MTLPITAAIKYLKQDQPINPGVDTTPEEYESYWHGIDEIETALEEAVYPLFALDSVYPEIDQWFESGLGAVNKLYYEFFLPRVEPTVKELVGTLQNPGIIPQVVLAGAARGNELIIKALLEVMAGKAAKPTNLSVTWDITHHAALEFSKSYAYGLVKGINNTTATAFQTVMQNWITAGGKLPDLIDAIEGDLPKLDIPKDWSPGKIKWATSRDRARLIAQTESTRAFAEGSLIRWNQLGYSQARFRSQNDRRVCDRCRKLHNVEGNSRDGWVLEGRAYFFPVHPGCRCFPSPIVKRIEATPFVSVPTMPVVKPSQAKFVPPTSQIMHVIHNPDRLGREESIETVAEGSLNLTKKVSVLGTSGSREDFFVKEMQYVGNFKNEQATGVAVRTMGMDNFTIPTFLLEEGKQLIVIQPFLSAKENKTLWELNQEDKDELLNNLSDQDQARIILFEYMINAGDRQPSQYLVNSENTSIKLIDNEAAFGTFETTVGKDENRFNVDFMGTAFTDMYIFSKKVKLYRDIEVNESTLEQLVTGAKNSIKEVSDILDPEALHWYQQRILVVDELLQRKKNGDIITLGDLSTLAKEYKPTPFY